MGWVEAQPTFVKLFPDQTKNIATAIDAFCNGCPIGIEYYHRSRKLKDYLHPVGAVIIGDSGETIFNDPTLTELKNVCNVCLHQNYPELVTPPK